MVIKVNWVAAEEGEEYLDLEDCDITQEEWEDMTEGQQKEVLQEFLNEIDNTIAYGLVSDYSVIDG